MTEFFTVYRTFLDYFLLSCLYLIKKVWKRISKWGTLYNIKVKYLLNPLNSAQKCISMNIA